MKIDALTDGNKELMEKTGKQLELIKERLAELSNEIDSGENKFHLVQECERAQKMNMELAIVEFEKYLEFLEGFDIVYHTFQNAIAFNSGRVETEEVK